MSANWKQYQPGAILHEVIVGCLRAAGTSFEAWCRENNVNRSTATTATYGQSGGDKGKKLLEKMIKDAGPEQVEAAYRSRVEKHAAELDAGEAA